MSDIEAFSEQKCPVCHARVERSLRYPHHVCENCCQRATDEVGRPLTFANVSFSGGFAALYRDTHEERDSHICYIDGVKCWADEAHMGGIVIQLYAEES